MVNFTVKFYKGKCEDIFNQLNRDNLRQNRKNMRERHYIIERAFTAEEID